MKYVNLQLEDNHAEAIEKYAADNKRSFRKACEVILINKAEELSKE